MDKLKHEFNVTPPRPRLIDKSSTFSARSRIMDDADGEGDYTDHLQQPNNTKKRKVPAATVVAAAREGTVAQGHDKPADETTPRDSQVNLFEKGTEGVGASPGRQEFDFQSIITGRRKICSPITLAALRLKELLKARRKMMMAAIRDDVDPLALEFALSAPFARPPARQLLRAWSYGPKFRRRPRNRAAPVLHRDPCFSGQFTFSVPSPISKRYIAAKKAATGLQLRFQTELARQATTAAEIALKTASKLSANPSSGERRKPDSGPAPVPSSGPITDKTLKKQNKTKKKKRSALANASNPHHLRNYVPSRVSHSGGHSVPSAHGQSNNWLGPLALKFLSATLPPRRKGRASGAETLGPSLVRPETEWICPFCEYSLFYSDDAAMHRAVKNRRRVLARRRNARERAAAAASRAIAPQSRDGSDDDGETEDGDDSFDDEDDDIVHSPALPQREGGKIDVRQDSRGPHPGG